MTVLWILGLFLLTSQSNGNSIKHFIDQYKGFDAEEFMTTADIIGHWGYPHETHKATTKDGYILTLHRIPNGKNERKVANESRPVVLFMHGLEDSSATWVINLPNQSAGFIFADKGYDVWLGNVRGNTYSKDHINYTQSDSNFWKFSWDEMAQHDLDAMFNKIENVTGQKQIYYVGHSQGTLIMFAKLSSTPEFSQRVKRFFALAPVATVKNIQGLLKYIADFVYPHFPQFFDLLGDGEFLPNNWFVKMITEYFCKNAIGEQICDSLIFLLAGPETGNLNKTRTPVYLSHSPASTSTQNILHWTQMVVSGNMQKFDYRSAMKNQEMYGQSTPPKYDLSKIQANIHLYSSKADYLADPKDIANTLVANLSSETLKEHTVFDVYSHIDFVWSPYIHKDVYELILKTINKVDNLP